MIRHDYKYLSRRKRIFTPKSHRGRGFVVTALAFGVLAAGGYYAYQYFAPGTVQAPVANPVTNQAEPVADIPAASAGATRQPLALSLTPRKAYSAAVTEEEARENPAEQPDSLAATGREIPPSADTSAGDADNSERPTVTGTGLDSRTGIVPALMQEVPAFEPKWHQETVKSGDSMARIFKRQKFSPSTLHHLMKIEQAKTLLRIKPGQVLEFQKTPSGDFAALRYPLNFSDSLVIRQEGEEFVAGTETKPVEHRQEFTSATIESSFYMAGKKAGMADGLIIELANVFGYDIDFALEIRKGDSFSVIYEDKYVDGKKVGYGEILSAEFVNQGDKYVAVRYTDSKGKVAYYTPEGKAMRKAFLRAPLNFSYVSSNFNPKRYHPILKRVKAHRGIDYRAPTGTPVRAAGDGRVLKSEYNRYNGNYVFLQHGNNIVTKYLHFSKRAVKRGQRVKQGQIIGYVGSTGLSQAPHVHYEFVVNGVHRNPRRVKFPEAAPVPKEELPRFKEQTRDLLAKLDVERKTYYAKLDQYRLEQ